MKKELYKINQVGESAHVLDIVTISKIDGVSFRARLSSTTEQQE